MNQREDENREKNMTLSFPEFGEMTVNLRDRGNRTSITPPNKSQEER